MAVMPIGESIPMASGNAFYYVSELGDKLYTNIQRYR